MDFMGRELEQWLKGPEDLARVRAALAALDRRYDVSAKIQREPGVKDILLQMLGRIERAYEGFGAVQGRRILDIACGSNTSRAPSYIYVDTPLGQQQIPIEHPEGYTAQFEPWFCRVLLELGAQPVGVDQGDLEGESFEHYAADLGRPGALNILPSASFDGIQDSRLFGSPEFTAQYPRQADRLAVAREIWRQEQRLLKPGGIIIHSDARQLIGML